MNEKILFKALILDSLIGCLEWQDRIRIHLYINAKLGNLSPKIIEVYQWIKYNNWEAPDINYGQDRLQYFSYIEYSSRYPIEDYIHYHPELKSELLKLKI